MAAPEAPPVPTTPETPPEPVVVTPEPQLPPSPEVIEEPAERTNLREVLKSATPEELEQLLEAAPPEARTQYEEKLKAKGMEAALTRKSQSEKATADRLSAWKPYVDNLPVAQNYVQSQLAKLKAGDMLDDPTLFEQATQQLNVGTLGKVVLENEAYVPALVEQYLPDLTAEEATKLEKPLYKFGQTGMAKEAVGAIFEAAVERAKAEAFAAGVQKGEGNLQAKESLLEKYEKVAKIRQEGAGVSPNGRPSSISDERARLAAEIAAFDPTKFTFAEAQKKWSELQAKETALRS